MRNIPAAAAAECEKWKRNGSLVLYTGMTKHWCKRYLSTRFYIYYTHLFIRHALYIPRFIAADSKILRSAKTPTLGDIISGCAKDKGGVSPIRQIPRRHHLLRHPKIKKKIGFFKQSFWKIPPSFRIVIDDILLYVFYTQLNIIM